MRANVWKELENYFLILLGTALMAIAIQWIFDRVGQKSTEWQWP